MARSNSPQISKALGDSLGAFFCLHVSKKDGQKSDCCQEQSFAKAREGIIVLAMKLALIFPVCCAAALTFTSCGGGGNRSASNSPGGITGPFDRNGNYVEEWADNPSKWRKNGGSSIARSEGLPQVAANDQPPANSNPLIASRSSVVTKSIAPKVTPTIAQTQVVTRPQPVVVRPVIIDRSAEIAAANRRREIARDRARENARDEARSKARAEAREEARAEARLDARREARVAALKKKGGRGKVEARPAKGKVVAKKPIVKAKAKSTVKAKAKKAVVPEKKKKKK